MIASHIISNAELGKRLRHARERLGYSQAKVGEHLGCSRTVVSRIELGKSKIDSTKLQVLADLYGHSMKGLLGPAFDYEAPGLLSTFKRLIFGRGG